MDNGQTIYDNRTLNHNLCVYLANDCQLPDTSTNPLPPQTNHSKSNTLPASHPGWPAQMPTSHILRPTASGQRIPGAAFSPTIMFS